MSIILLPKRKQNGLQHHLQVFTHYCHLSLPQESSDLDASLKRLHVLEGGLGKIFLFFFIPAGKEALSPGAGLLCFLVNQALQQRDFILNPK